MGPMFTFGYLTARTGTKSFRTEGQPVLICIKKCLPTDYAGRAGYR